MRGLKQGLSVVLLCGIGLALSGCNPQAKGFALPPGDALAGQATFTELGCNACHSVKGKIERRTDGADATVNVTLGGEVTRVKTYGDLVTSIINPSHKLSRGTDSTTLTADGASKMPNYNQTMTVQQMLDLTTFLQDSYTVWVPDYGPYYFP